MVRTLIVAADPLARAALAMLLEDQDEIEIVGRASGNDDLDTALDVFRPTVLLWDLGWDTGAEAELLSQQSDIDIPIIALLPDNSLKDRLLNAGVHGLLLRDSQGPQLAGALRAVEIPLIVIDPDLYDPEPTVSPINTPPIESLTTRETEVLVQLSHGLTNKGIATRLSISPHTVKFHITSIMNKLDAQSRTEAVMIASRLGLLPV